MFTICSSGARRICVFLTYQYGLRPKLSVIRTHGSKRSWKVSGLSNAAHKERSQA